MKEFEIGGEELGESQVSTKNAMLICFCLIKYSISSAFPLIPLVLKNIMFFLDIDIVVV